ncbi:gamma-glutamyltransferase [Vallicoccus soli]|uniref:Gamma-glutamyltransferase n=1 Tax=Vallicoccus soli TaxID=2339232 RepID=A0A3A3YUK7_9ACTN|nr:gamma-glutamyltransferase [Vallicoccus soli]RJK92756.1 gamma-glutamyltransferase [Vallicoccus soli]
MGTGAAVAASDALAAAAGARLAAQGGNAVDAALAAVLVAMVCEPGICALAGGAFVTVAPADGPSVTVDGNVEMPGRGKPAEAFGRGAFDVTTAYGGGLTTTIGHGSVATPGALAALGEAHRRYGRAPWREVVAPVLEAVEEGFPLGGASAYYLGFVREPVFGWHPDSRRALHHADGSPVVEGERLRIAHLADSLHQVSEEGPGTLYTGGLAELVAADMAAHDGLLGAADLAAYEPAVSPTLDVRVGDWDVATNPPPAIGGVSLAAMLALLDGRPRGDWTPQDRLRLAAVQEAVLTHRVRHLDAAEDRTAAALALLDLLPGGVEAVRGSGSTVHVSVVDAEGGACAVTASAGYGSGVMTPGTGLWLNNCLGEPELNRRGFHGWSPGQRLPSNMAPTVARHPDGSVLAIGSPGADRITTALTQAVAGFMGGLPLDTAIALPRLHVQPGPDGTVLHVERDLDLPEAAGLTARVRVHDPRSMFFGGVQAALRRGDGSLQAAADPRRDAAVAVVEP